MKRIVSILLMMAVALSLCACGPDAAAGSEAPSPAPTASPAPSAGSTEAPAGTPAPDVPADEGARVYIEATKALTADDLERRDTGLSGEEYSALLGELGVPEEAVAELAWYRTPDGAPLFLEVFSFRLTDGADCDAIARALGDYGTARSKEANASYIAAQGQSGTYQLMQQSVAAPGYALLGLISFDENGAPLGTVKEHSLPSTLFSYCYHVGCVSETTQKIDGKEYITKSPPGNASSSGFVTVLDQSGGAPEPTPDPVTGRIPYTAPGKEDMTVYDTSAILAAWKKGDPSSLSDYDRAIYDAAEKVLAETLTDGMSDYEKEYALYLWVITTVEYDDDHYDPLAEVRRDSYGPYGGLVEHRGICLGYASTFQLLMDMAGVECITVVGAAGNSQDEHAWNQVCLNGEWYCVDPTWDMSYYPVEGHLCWFNLTSDYFATEKPNHQWDYDSVPEATATDGGK